MKKIVQRSGQLLTAPYAGTIGTPKRQAVFIVAARRDEEETGFSPVIALDSLVLHLLGPVASHPLRIHCPSTDSLVLMGAVLNSTRRLHDGVATSPAIAVSVRSSCQYLCAFCR